MFLPGQIQLFWGAVASFAAALLHVIVVLVGPAAYSYFGGPELARLADAGSSIPAAMTLSLAALFTVFGVYGLSGAGILPRLPMLHVVLLIVGGVYAFRGLSVVEQSLSFFLSPESVPLRMPLYSLIALITGGLYIVGVMKSWDRTHSGEKQKKGSRFEP